jgi:hypothetical protein
LFVRRIEREHDSNVGWAVGIVRGKVGPIESIGVMQGDERDLRAEDREHPLKRILFPRRVEELTSFGVDRAPMASDVCKIVLLEGQAQRLEKLGNLIGGLI